MGLCELAPLVSPIVVDAFGVGVAFAGAGGAGGSVEVALVGCIQPTVYQWI